MAVSTLSQVEVFVAAGTDRWHDVQALRACDTIRLVATPRHASVLLVAGTIPDAHREQLDRVHDQLPHPRAVVTWEETATRDANDGDVRVVARAIVDQGNACEANPSSSSPNRLPDVDPNHWRGVGPFGQGGEGMMGGTPYGRPMAMTAGDRDGLALDQLHLRLGPFLGPLPGGLVADVALQGEVIQSIEFLCAGGAPLVTPERQLTLRRRLLWLSHALHVRGLDAFAVRAARLARGTAGVDGTAAAVALADEFRSLRRRLRWTGMPSTLRGVGEHDGADAWDRWKAHLDAIATGIDDLSLRGGDPRPHASAFARDQPVTASALAATLTGMTLTDAVSTIVSFDLDVPVPANATVDP